MAQKTGKVRSSAKADTTAAAPQLAVLKKRELRSHGPQRVEAGNSVFYVVEDGAHEAVDNREVKTVIQESDTGVLTQVISASELSDFEAGLEARERRIAAATAVEDSGEKIYATGSLDGVDFIITQEGDDEFTRKAYRVNDDGSVIEAEVEDFLPEPEEEEEAE